MKSTEEIVAILTELTNTVNEYSAKTEKLNELISCWLDMADDTVYAEAARITYFECAKSVVKIMTEKQTQ